MDDDVDNPFEPGAPVDGRQSAAALVIRRGLRRYLASLGAASLCEVSLATGRRADVMALHRDGGVSIIEIKSSLADFRADGKWRDYLPWCDRFAFAVGPDFPLAVLPEDVGVIVADAFAAMPLREGARHPLAAARRKAVTQRFARTAALRLYALEDPIGAAGLMD